MVTTYITDSLTLHVAYYIDDGEYNMSLDCEDLLLSFSEAMFYPKQAHLFSFELFLVTNCCRKTAVCIGDQFLDFSVPELDGSQSTFSTDPEILQNCTGFTLCSSVGLAVDEVSAVMGLTPCMLCVHINYVLCVLDYYLLISQL